MQYNMFCMYDRFEAVQMQPLCCFPLSPDFVICKAKHIFHLYRARRDEIDNQSSHLTSRKKANRRISPNVKEKNKLLVF